MILMRVSAAADPAAVLRPDSCLCGRQPDLVLALGSAFGSLGQTNGGSSQFDWLPGVVERNWVYIVIHHSATEGGSVDSIHDQHRNRKDASGKNWLGIGYHFVIGNGSGMSDGQIEETFRWRGQIHGAHSGSAIHNANGIGICLIGNFQEDAPSQRQLESVTRLVRQLADRYQIRKNLIIGHKSVKPTACPGALFPLQDLVQNALKPDPARHSKVR